MSETAGIYLRVSTEAQEDAKTIEGQRIECTDYAESQGWKIFDTYEDKALSGAFLEGRDDFIRMMEDMQDKRFDILLVSEHSRVTRTEDPEERGRILKLLKDSGIKLASPHEGTLDLSMFTGELLTTLKLMFAAEERAETTRRMKRGKRRKLMNGEYCFHSVPYGLQKRTEKEGTKTKHFVEYHEEERKVLKEIIYPKIVEEGYSLNELAKYLNARGIPTKRPQYRGKKVEWTEANISAMLRNENSLTGTIYAMQNVWKKVGSNKMKLVKKLKPEESIPIKVPVLFTKEEYKRLRKAIEKNRVEPSIKQERYLLRNKVRCGLCGAPYYVRSGGRPYIHYYYGCKNSLHPEEGKERCKAPFVNKDILDAEVERNLLIGFYLTPTEVLSKWIKSGKAKSSHIKRLNQKLKQLDKDIKTKRLEEEKLLSDAIQSIFEPDMIKKKKEELEAELLTLMQERKENEKKLKELKAYQANREALNEAAEELKVLGPLLRERRAGMSTEDKQKLIRHFIPPDAYIEIFPCPSGEKRVVDIPLLPRKVRVRWIWKLWGKWNVRAVVDALKKYEQYGIMEEPIDYGQEKNIKNETL